MAEILGEFLAQFIVGLLIAAIAGFGTFITAMWRCLQKQSKSLFRLKKGFVLYMRLQTKETEKLHPGSNITENEIEEIIKEMMTDDEGKF